MVLGNQYFNLNLVANTLDLYPTPFPILLEHCTKGTISNIAHNWSDTS